MASDASELGHSGYEGSEAQRFARERAAAAHAELHREPTCAECGAVIQGAPFDGDKPTRRHCWECGAVYEPTEVEHG